MTSQSLRNRRSEGLTCNDCQPSLLHSCKDRAAASARTERQVTKQTQTLPFYHDVLAQLTAVAAPRCFKPLEMKLKDEWSSVEREGDIREISSRPLTPTCELKTSLLLVSCSHSESTCTWSRRLATASPTAIPHLLFPSKISGFVKSRRASVILSAFLISRERSAVSIRSYQQ